MTVTCALTEYIKRDYNYHQIVRVMKCKRPTQVQLVREKPNMFSHSPVLPASLVCMQGGACGVTEVAQRSTYTLSA